MTTAARTHPQWAIMVLLAFFVACCLLFARVQNVWIDESTQLSGVRLSVTDLVAWLAGARTERFGVPGDRMPPLAYLFDLLWSRIVGNAELPFREFHVMIAAIGVVVIARAERAMLGVQWFGAGLMFLVLSPKLINLTPELRCYPLFFAGSCAVLALFLDLVRGEGPLPWRKLLTFGGVCLLICYVHFFGVVASFAFFVTLLIAFARDRLSLVRILTVGGALASGQLGLYPFVFGAATVSSFGDTAGTGDVLRYFPMLIGHPASLLFPFGSSLFFGGFAALVLAAGLGALLRARRHQLEAPDWLVLVAIIGAAASVLPGFFIHSFNTLKPDYSIWILPVIALIVASGASRPLGCVWWDRSARYIALSAMLTGAAISTALFLSHGER